RHNVLPLSKFGLMEITRQRVRQVTTIETAEECPACNGTGKIKPSILLEEDIDNMLEFLFQKQGESHITLAVHPIIYAFLTKGLVSKRMKWFFKYKKWVRLAAKQDYHFLEYKFFDKNKEEIMLWEKKHVI
ncbi:MAG: ribonuclease E/G, partial [Bacteroidales bacterium]|nr:ribonuclease E/G [Bacteroidales bacterium]